MPEFSEVAEGGHDPRLVAAVEVARRRLGPDAGLPAIQDEAGRLLEDPVWQAAYERARATMADDRDGLLRALEEFYA
jgi:hypothetical protein